MHHLTNRATLIQLKESRSAANTQSCMSVQFYLGRVMLVSGGDGIQSLSISRWINSTISLVLRVNWRCTYCCHKIIPRVSIGSIWSYINYVELSRAVLLPCLCWCCFLMDGLFVLFVASCWLNNSLDLGLWCIRGWKVLKCTLCYLTLLLCMPSANHDGKAWFGTSSG